MAGPVIVGRFFLLHVKVEYVFLLQGKGSRTSMFVQSLRSDPYRVSFIIFLVSCCLFLYIPQDPLPLLFSQFRREV